MAPPYCISSFIPPNGLILGRAERNLVNPNPTSRHEMKSFDVRALEDFYVRISAEGGLSVAGFQTEFMDLFKRPRSSIDLNDYRMSKLPWKKMADEVAPLSRFLRFNGMDSGRVRFPLDNQPPDCWLWHGDSETPVGIEVTVAQGTERFHLAKEVVDIGQGRGFIGISDDASRAAFKRALSTPRVMYSTPQALSAIKCGILRCLSRKNKKEFAGLTLLIQAPMSSLPRERWDAIKIDLREAAAQVPFAEVHVISNADEELWGFQIKGEII